MSLRLYPISLIALSVRARNASLTVEVPFNTAETVKIDTFAASATCTIVGDVVFRVMVLRRVTKVLLDDRGCSSDAHWPAA